MRKSIVIIVLLAAAWSLKAQQKEQYSMYMMNNFMVNPAEGGTEEFIDIKLGYRTQWVNFDGAPQTFFLSGHAPINKHQSRFDDVDPLPFHGVGGIVSRDAIGPFNITSAKVSYAYHLPVYKSLILSLGAFAGIKQYELKAGDLNFDSQGTQDNQFYANEVVTTPDVSFGFWGYAKHYYFGVATFQLLTSNLNIGDENAPGATTKGQLDMHHWVTGGYWVKLNDDFSLVPSFVAKFVKPAPVSFDLNLKFKYKDVAWLGASWRQEDAFVGIVGVTAKKRLDIAYSFDFTTSDLQDYNDGSHEILLGLRLPNHEHEPPPSQFW